MLSITRRRVVALTAAIAGVCLLVTTGCGAAQSAAVRVDGQAYSDAELRDELDAFGDALFSDPQAAESIRGELAESYDQQFVGRVLQQRIIFMLGEQIFDDRGLELDKAQREQARQRLSAQFGGAVDTFPDSFLQSLIDDIARTNALGEELGEEGLNDALVERANSVEIDVGSRYGSWDDEQYTVVPPDGPAVSERPMDAPAGVPGG